MHLIVIHPFTLQNMDEDKKVVSREFKRGDKIFDQVEIDEILAGSNARNVVRTVESMNGQKVN